MPRTWTPEQRAAAAERIRQNKPWEKSTGPRTRAGKKRSSKNAVRHGQDADLLRRTRKLMALSRETLRLAAILRRERTE